MCVLYSKADNAAQNGHTSGPTAAKHQNSLR